MDLVNKVVNILQASEGGVITWEALRDQLDYREQRQLLNVCRYMEQEGIGTRELNKQGLFVKLTPQPEAEPVNEGSE